MCIFLNFDYSNHIFAGLNVSGKKRFQISQHDGTIRFCRTPIILLIFRIASLVRATLGLNALATIQAQTVSWFTI